MNIIDIDVAIAAPTIPNFGMNITFRMIFIRAQRALTLNSIFTFPILDKVPPIATTGHKSYNQSVILAEVGMQAKTLL